MTNRRSAVVLASRSPRRARLLDELGLDVTVHPATVDEDAVMARLDGAAPETVALAIAMHKAASVVGRLDGLDVPLLAADTLVVGPRGPVAAAADRAAAVRTLTELSGQVIRVATAVVVVDPDGAARTSHRVSTVTLGDIDSGAARAYVATGAADDTAAGLELQDRAAPFLAGVDGCWTNVVGLPVCVAAALLTGVDPSRLCRNRDGGPCGEPSPDVRQLDMASGRLAP